MLGELVNWFKNILNPQEPPGEIVVSEVVGVQTVVSKTGDTNYEALQVNNNIASLQQMVNIPVNSIGVVEHYHKDTDGFWKADCCGNEVVYPIQTSTGKVLARPTDWVIKNKATGELAVVDSTTFAKNYKPVKVADA
jgi:hypothetical protein